MAENLKSTPITNLDGSSTTGIITQNTTGEGAAGPVKTVDAYVTPQTGALHSTYRMVRFPTNAKVKEFKLFSDGALDTNASPTLAIDVNVAFSDSAYDGTAGQNQGNIPTTAGNAVTTVASYSSPNILFGTYTVTSHTAGFSQDLTFNGTNYSMVVNMGIALWRVFGFLYDPGGFFDILLYVSTAAATIDSTGTVNLGARLSYVE